MLGKVRAYGLLWSDSLKLSRPAPIAKHALLDTQGQLDHPARMRRS